MTFEREPEGMKPISVLIPDGEHPLALRVMRSLGLTHRVTIDLMTSHRWPSSGLSRFCRRRHFTASSITGKDRCDAILKTIATVPIDVLLPVSVAGIYLLAAERRSLSRQVALPPLPDSAALDTANDKTALCRFARRHGVPMPPFLVFPDEVPEPGALRRLAYPVLLKPPSLEGGRGFQLFHDPQTLANFLETSPAVRTGGRYLLQSYLPGSDFGLNVLCRDGEILAFTVQRNALSASPPFGPAAGIHFVQDAQVLETGRRLLSALRWNGVANLDMLRCAATGETMLLEMNPRYWGTLMGSVHAGINFPYLACLVALGRPFPQTEYQPITYTEKFVALKQALRMVAGRPLLAGFRFRNTALSVALTDPLPALAYYCKSIVKSSAARVVRAGRRSRNDS
jgi:predicted ATP-grasp superfamily ATP-dependent carboligase